MRLADACVLLWSGELDILHILRYKYCCDIYYTLKGSGAKALGLLNVFLRCIYLFWGNAFS